MRRAVFPTPGPQCVWRGKIQSVSLISPQQTPLLEMLALAKVRRPSHPDSIPRNKRCGWRVEGGGEEGTAPLEELQVPQSGQGMHPVPVLGAAAGKLPKSGPPTLAELWPSLPSQHICLYRGRLLKDKQNMFAGSSIQGWKLRIQTCLRRGGWR